MLPRGLGGNAEQKLKLQIFFISTGLFMLVSSMLFDNWFYYQSVAFSVSAINTHSAIKATNYNHECATLVSYNSEFLCYCSEEACELLERVHIAGCLYIFAVVASLPFYICIIANINRKIERLPLSFGPETECLDREFFHFIAPSIAALGFITWVVIVYSSDAIRIFGDNELTLGPAFTNAALGLAVLLGNMSHYIASVQKSYQAEINS